MAGSIKTLDGFRTEFKGYRSNRFLIIPSFPTTGINYGSFSRLSNVTEIYVKAAQIPGAAIGYLPLNYRGRNIKFPAERSFMDWGMQVYGSNSPNKNLRGAFLEWMNNMNSSKHTKMDYDLVSPEPWQIYWNDMNGTESGKSYKYSAFLYNCFPIEISPIEMSNDLTDAFAEFTVTMVFDYVEHKEL